MRTRSYRPRVHLTRRLKESSPNERIRRSAQRRRSVREQAPLQDGLGEGSGFGRSSIEKQMGGGGKARWLENRAKKVDRGTGQTDRLPWRRFGGSDGNDLQRLATRRGRLSEWLRLRRCRARTTIMRRHPFGVMIRDHGQPERAMIGKRQPRDRSQHDRDPAKGGRSASLPHEWPFSAGKSVLCQLLVVSPHRSLLMVLPQTSGLV